MELHFSRFSPIPINDAVLDKTVCAIDSYRRMQSIKKTFDCAIMSKKNWYIMCEPQLASSYIIFVDGRALGYC